MKSENGCWRFLNRRNLVSLYFFRGACLISATSPRKRMKELLEKLCKRLKRMSFSSRFPEKLLNPELKVNIGCQPFFFSRKGKRKLSGIYFIFHVTITLKRRLLDFFSTNETKQVEQFRKKMLINLGIVAFRQACFKLLQMRESNVEWRTRTRRKRHDRKTGFSWEDCWFRNY